VHSTRALQSRRRGWSLPARCRSVYTLCEPTGGGCVADPSKTPPRTWVVPSRPPSRSHNQMLMAIRIQNSLHLSQTLQSFDASAIMTVLRQVACGRTPPCVAPVGRSTRPTSAERAVLVHCRVGPPIQPAVACLSARTRGRKTRLTLKGLRQECSRWLSPSLLSTQTSPASRHRLHWRPANSTSAHPEHVIFYFATCSSRHTCTQ
jgi:hypothetical protein